MTKLWVKFKSNNATKVSTEQCQDVDDFLKACKKELPHLLGSYDVDQLSLSTTADGPSLRPGLVLTDIASQPGYFANKDEHPLFISIANGSVQDIIGSVQNKMVSMSYREAAMPFISEATGVEDYYDLWENIPVDTTVEASPEFVELFKKNCSVYEFDSMASRRTLIELFLREIVSQFPDFIIDRESHMTLVNEVKRRRLNGKCDYTIFRRGFRNLPYLVTIVAELYNRETLLQCIGECASIHYHRKEAGMRNLKVYGIHSTGSFWIFVFIDENGSVFVSSEYLLYVREYVKEEFDLIYRLVYYVVKQSYINSP